MTSLQMMGKAAEVCAALSAVALARRRPGHVPAAVALMVLAGLDLLGGPIVAALAPMPPPIEGPARMLVYLEVAAQLGTGAVVPGLAVAVAVSPERRRVAVAAVTGAWLLASVVLAALYPSPLVRGAGLQRIYFGADLFGLFVSTVALVKRSQQLTAAKLSPDSASIVALSLVVLDGLILLLPFSPWRGDLFGSSFAGVQLIVTLFFGVFAIVQVIAWKAFSRG